MLGLLIATLVIVCVHLAAYLYLNFWAVVSVKAAITRQDDRLRKRAERQVLEADEDDIGQLVDGIRRRAERGDLADADDDYAELRARYPDARLPEEL